MNALTKLTIRRPDDWHVHLREGDMLAAVLPDTARQFARAIVMPNLADPITTAAKAAEYRRLILQALPEDAAAQRFLPLMTCYLTDDTDPVALEEGFLDGVFTAVKFYPAHATTGSAFGVTDPLACTAVFEAMQRLGMPLLIHGEVTDPAIDIFDREAVFIERILTPLLANFPELRVVLEHVTTADAVEFVRAQPGRIAATITAHHLLINRNAIFEGGIRPHHYCLPVAKRERHRLALRNAACSGEAWFFLGTDSAPHPVDDKEAACGCAGIYTAGAAMSLYAEVFEEEGALEHLEAFASINGPRFYGLAENEETVDLIREDWAVPVALPVEGGIAVKNFRGGEIMRWRIAGLLG